MDDKTISAAIATATLKASPPVAVLATALVGINWQTIVWILTALYLILQSALTIKQLRSRNRK